MIVLVLTQKKLRLRFAQEEAQAAEGSATSGAGLGAFLTTGLDLEQMQLVQPFLIILSLLMYSLGDLWHSSLQGRTQMQRPSVSRSIA